MGRLPRTVQVGLVKSCEPSKAEKLLRLEPEMRQKEKWRDSNQEKEFMCPCLCKERGVMRGPLGAQWPQGDN